jgi:hypothetical protein
MQIELIGCTSAGKSTLAAQLVSAGQRAGVRIEKSYDYLLQRYGVGWVHQHQFRMLLLNLLAVPAAFGYFLRQPALFWWLLLHLRQLPAAVSVGERLKIARITCRNLGIHALIQRAPADQLILADEGNVQIAHYLFVHLVQQPDLAAIEAYLRLVPLPDLVLYYKQPQAVLVERTLRRGHKRIPTCTLDQVQQFIAHAAGTFAHMASVPRLQERLITVDGQSHALVQQPSAGTLAEEQLIVAHLLGQLAARERPENNTQTTERASRVVNLS